ncbi:MAG: hypothetical protein AVDCRST_MAG87-2695, partial [uncultured Thermomicrobiales bacterium]
AEVPAHDRDSNRDPAHPERRRPPGSDPRLAAQPRSSPWLWRLGAGAEPPAGCHGGDQHRQPALHRADRTAGIAAGVVRDQGGGNPAPLQPAHRRLGGDPLPARPVAVRSGCRAGDRRSRDRLPGHRGSVPAADQAHLMAVGGHDGPFRRHALRPGVGGCHQHAGISRLQPRAGHDERPPAPDRDARDPDPDDRHDDLSRARHITADRTYAVAVLPWWPARRRPARSLV